MSSTSMHSTAATSPRRSRGTLNFPGPQSVQQRRQRTITKTLGRQADELEREARRLRSYAEKIGAAPERLHDTEFLCRLVNIAPCAWRAVMVLCGFEPIYVHAFTASKFTHDERRILLLDLIMSGVSGGLEKFAQPVGRLCKGHSVEFTFDRKFYRHFDEELLCFVKDAKRKQIQTPETKSQKPFDALREATHVVHMAAGGLDGRIDWTREPTSDQERLVRRRWIERLIRKNGLHLALSHLCLMAIEIEDLASDLARAYDVLFTASEALTRQKEQHEIAEIQREVAFGTQGGSNEEADRDDDRIEKIRRRLNPIDPEELIRRIFEVE